MIVEKNGKEVTELIRYEFKPKFKLYTWHTIFITATTNKINVHKRSNDTGEIAPIFEQEIERASTMVRGSVVLKSISGTVGID